MIIAISTMFVSAGGLIGHIICKAIDKALNEYLIDSSR